MKTTYKSIIIVALVGLFASLLSFSIVQAAPPPPDQASYIIVHALNPEGIEIASIVGMGPYSVQIYDGDTFIGYSAHNEETRNQPIAITSGEHTIKVKFNGMTLEQEIDIAANETKVLTFTFERTEISPEELISFSWDISATEEYTVEGDTFVLGPWYIAEYKDLTIPVESAVVGGACTQVRYMSYEPGQATFSLSISSQGVATPETYSASVSGSGQVLSGVGGFSSAIVGVGYVSKYPSAILGYPFDRWYIQNNSEDIAEMRVRLFMEYMPPSGVDLVQRGETGYYLRSIPLKLPPGKEWSGIEFIWSHAKIESLTYSQSWELSGSFTKRLTLETLEITSVPYDLTGTGIKDEEINLPPVASFTYLPEKPVVGQSITFDGSSSGDPEGSPLTYKWDFNDSTFGTGKVVTHSYSQPGTYEVKLVVNDGKLDSLPAYLVVVVKEPVVQVWTGGQGVDGSIVWPLDSWKEQSSDAIAVHVKAMAGDQPIEGATIFFEGQSRGQTDANGYVRFLFPIFADEPMTPGPFISTAEAHWDGMVAVSEPTLIYEVTRVDHKTVILSPGEAYLYNRLIDLSVYPLTAVPPDPPIKRIQNTDTFALHWFGGYDAGLYMNLQPADTFVVSTYKLTAPSMAPAWLITERAYRNGDTIRRGDTWTGSESNYKTAVGKGLLDRRILWFELHSPAVIYITAPDGSHAGYDSSTGELVADFPIAISDSGDEPFRLFILQPLEGEYLLNVVGTGAGSYTLSMHVLNSDGIAGPDLTFTNTIKEGEIHIYGLMLSGSGDIAIERIPAKVRIEPETLNLASQGTFNAFIQLPEGYDVADIDASTVVCEGAPAIKGMISEKDKGTYTAKFNRQDLVDVSIGDAVTLRVTGKVLYNGSPLDFEGSDTIRVVDEGNGKNDNHEGNGKK